MISTRLARAGALVRRHTLPHRKRWAMRSLHPPGFSNVELDSGQNTMMLTFLLYDRPPSPVL